MEDELYGQVIPVTGWVSIRGLRSFRLVPLPKNWFLERPESILAATGAMLGAESSPALLSGKSHPYRAPQRVNSTGFFAWPWAVLQQGGECGNGCGTGFFAAANPRVLSRGGDNYRPCESMGLIDQHMKLTGTMEIEEKNLITGEK